MVSQEQKCIWIISQVRLPPLSLSLALLVGVGPGEAPSLSLSLTLLVGVAPGEAPPLSLSLALLVGVGRGPPLYLSADTAPPSLSLDSSAEAPGVRVVEVLES